jgi:putative nucleotidyltransferase with HDIG domain
LREVETVIRSVSLAMQTEQDALLPLVKLKSVDQYTTVHACNVAMLSMALAESLGGGSREVRAVGTAALLHDIGKVRLPAERLSHPGALSTSEQEIMRPHSVEGARLLGERGAGNALAAIVAYAQHIWANGKGGYPGDTFPRRPHAAAHAAPGRP